MKQLNVGLGARSYPILISSDLLSGIGADLKERAIAKRYVVVSDSVVAPLYGPLVMESLKNAGFKPELIVFPHGEVSKTLATVGDLASQLAGMGIDRKDGLIALGGGVTGDITGFLASSYMRGIAFVQVPTTLLAQVDSSVGGKTGVDIPEGKNLVGAFYQPRCVYIDIDVLKSLSEFEMFNGIAEVIKYGVIYDRDFFTFLAENRLALLAQDEPVITKVIDTCCAIKAEIVGKDETESDLRRILNFGHTIGHAVEADSNYQLAHGLAVAIGMVAACRLAVTTGLMDSCQAGDVEQVIKDFGLPTEIPETADLERLQYYLLTDKKTVSGKPFFVLPTRIGEVVVSDAVSVENIIEVLTPRTGNQ